MTADARSSTPKRRTWRSRLLRAAGWTVLALAAAAAGFSAWIEHACIFEPPAIPAGHPAMSLSATQESPSLRRCGPAWLVTGEGINELYIEGDPVARGRQMAELCGAYLAEEEFDMRAQVDRVLPEGARRWAVRKGVLFAFRNLQRYLEPGEELELAAALPTCAAMPAGPMDGVVPTYHRLVFYQALYDAGQAMAEAGLVDTDAGCTSFAASGAATSGGGLVVARNCDFEGGDVFDRRKVVYFVKPQEGQRYVAVSWSGMIGVLSGVNESGLVVMLHAARTERTKWPQVGRPIPLILAAAMREDRTIEDVARRFRESPFHAAAMIVVAETTSGRSAVVETDPDRTVVVPDADGVTVCANHLRDGAWDGDEVVRRIRRSGSSALRFARMEELVGAARGRIDAPTAAAFLRDRRGVGATDVGLGNRTAISAMIAAHAVVWDGAARRLYVSRAPRGLGEFVAYDTGAFFDGTSPPSPDSVRANAPPIAASADVSFAASIGEARELLRSSDAARLAGRAGDALHDAEKAVTLMDRAPPALLAQAEALLALGRPGEARDAASVALARQPVPGAESERLRVIAR